MHIIIFGEGVFVQKQMIKSIEIISKHYIKERTGSYILAMDDGSEIKTELLKFISHLFKYIYIYILCSSLKNSHDFLLSHHLLGIP